MNTDTFDLMLNEAYINARRARKFATELEKDTSIKPSVAKMWHELADKLFEVSGHGDLMRSGDLLK